MGAALSEAREQNAVEVLSIDDHYGLGVSEPGTKVYSIQGSSLLQLQLFEQNFFAFYQLYIIHEHRLILDKLSPIGIQSED